MTNPIPPLQVENKSQKKPKYKESQKAYRRRPDIQARQLEGQRRRYHEQKKVEWYKAYGRTEASKKRTREYRQKIRTKVFDLLGHSCAICGVSERIFLTIDHINGGGNRHRRATKSDLSQWRGILALEAAAKDQFRTLCYNCNCAIGHHSEEIVRAAIASRRVVVDGVEQEVKIWER